MPLSVRRAELVGVPERLIVRTNMMDIHLELKEMDW